MFLFKKKKELINLDTSTVKLILDTYNKIDLTTISNRLNFDNINTYTYILYIMYSERLSVDEVLNATKLDNDYKFIQINKKGSKRDHRCSTVTSNLLKELRIHTATHNSYSTIFITNYYDQNYHKKLILEHLEATLKTLKKKDNIAFDSFSKSFNNLLEEKERGVSYYPNSDPYILLIVDKHLEVFKNGWVM